MKATGPRRNASNVLGGAAGGHWAVERAQLSTYAPPPDEAATAIEAHNNTAATTAPDATRATLMLGPYA
ncbi:MAG TPA: hypothetical protein VGO39_12995 [Gaiellaceae bacterium]|nr:hypothetical protein [Gaiellaceae bacterium]